MTRRKLWTMKWKLCCRSMVKYATALGCRRIWGREELVAYVQEQGLMETLTEGKTIVKLIGVPGKLVNAVVK